MSRADPNSHGVAQGGAPHQSHNGGGRGRPPSGRYDQRVFRIDGIDGESIVVEGNWVEKLRSNTSRGRNPVDRYSGTQIKEFSRRKKLFGADKEQLLQVIVNVGTFYSLNVPAERRADVDALVAELEKARDRAPS